MSEPRKLKSQAISSSAHSTRALQPLSTRDWRTFTSYGYNEIGRDANQEKVIVIVCSPNANRHHWDSQYTTSLIIKVDIIHDPMFALQWSISYKKYFTFSRTDSPEYSTLWPKILSKLEEKEREGEIRNELQNDIYIYICEFSFYSNSYTRRVSIEELNFTQERSRRQAPSHRRDVEVDHCLPTLHPQGSRQQEQAYAQPMGKGLL